MDSNRRELSTILDALKEQGKGMTIMEISKAVGLNRHSVAKYMAVLVAAGQVDMRSFGPSKFFSISQRVPISAMLSFSSDMIMTMDKDLRIRNVNDRFLKFTGLERGEVLQENIQIFSHSMQTDPPLMPYIRAALGGKECSVETRYNGKEKNNYFIMKVLPTIFVDGENGVTLILSDITARVEAEEALRKERADLEIRVKERTAELEAEIAKRISYENALKASEEKYRSLVENINDTIWEVDAEGRFTYLSPSVVNILGYEPRELIGKTMDQILAPSTREATMADIGETLAEPQSLKMKEATYLHRDGHEVAVEVNGTPLFDEAGRFRGYRGVTRDVTVRKRAEAALQRAEEKLRNTIENVNDIVWEMDREARFTYVNPRVRDILGFGPEHYLGRVIVEFMPPEDVPEFMEGFGRIFAKPRPYSFEYFRMFHRDGRILSFEVNGSPFYDEDCQFAGFQGVTRDITNRKSPGH